MKLLLPLALFFGLCLCRFAAAQTSATEEEKAVLRFENDLCVAYLKGDVAALTRGLTDDYTLTNSKGQVTTKADDLDDARKGAVRYEAFENHDMQVRLYGNAAAVVIGRTVLRGTAEGKPIAGEFRFTDTLVRGPGGAWQLAAGHATRLGN